MKVALIEPPLIDHTLRGTGVYSDSLFSSLEKSNKINVVKCRKDRLPTTVDLYHFPYFDPFFLTLPLIRAKKTIITVHDLIPIHFPQYFPRGFRGELKWQIQKTLLKKVDAIITDSQTSKKDIIHFVQFPENKIHVIYLAPNNEFFESKTVVEKRRVRANYGLPNNYILFVGEGNWNKNLLNVIKAVNYTHTALVIISQSYQTCNLNHPANKYLLEAKKLAGDNILIRSLAKVNIQDLVCIYQMADMLLFPSFYEGFGLPIVEAFASGCPVISSNRGSLSEIIDDAVVVVQPNNVNAITIAIKELLQNKKLRNYLITQGKKTIKKFSWSQTADKTIKVYHQILQN